MPESVKCLCRGADAGIQARSTSRTALAGLVAACFLLSLLAACGSAEKSLRRAEAALTLGEYAEAAGQFKQAYQRTL